MNESELRLQFLEAQLQRNERWTSLADAKAGAVLVSVPALSGLAAPRVVQFSIDRYSALIALAESGWEVPATILYGALVLIVVVFATLSVWYAVNAIAPRTKVKGQDIGGNIFFRHVSSRGFKSFNDSVLTMDLDDQVNEYIRQVFATASVCDEKYKQVQCAIRFAVWFVGSSLLAYGIALIASGI